MDAFETGGTMIQLTLLEQGHLADKDVYFCRFCDEGERKVRVIVTAQTLSEFKKDFRCDLEKICRHAGEYAIRNGIEDDVELTGETYLAVKRRLRNSRS